MEKAMNGVRATSRSAFTLIELVVVIGIIALILAILTPSLIGMFNAGADIQAVNMLAAQLTAARALAIRENSYVAVHVQNSTDGHQYMGTLVYCAATNAFEWDKIVLDPNDSTSVTYSNDVNNNRGVLTDTKQVAFSLQCQYVGYYLEANTVPSQIRRIVGGTQSTLYVSPPWKSSPPAAKTPYRVFRYLGNTPQWLPGTMAFGDISNSRILDDANHTFKGEGVQNTTALNDFMTFNIVFSPYGNLVTRQPDGSDIVANCGSSIWDASVGEPGTSAVTLFDLQELTRMSYSQRVAYLQKNGQFLPINMQTGQLFPRK